MTLETNSISKFVETFERVALSDTVDAWVTLLAMALILTILVVCIQQYQIALLSKVVTDRTHQLEAIRQNFQSSYAELEAAKSEALDS